MKKNIRKSMSVLLSVLMLICVFAGCSGSGEGSSSAPSGSGRELTGATVAEDGVFTLDIIRNIEMDSVTRDGNCVYFDVYVSAEQSVRFCGLDISISDDGIEFAPRGMLFSLDHMGKLLTLDIGTDDPHAWIDYGMAYADSAAVKSLSQLRAAFPHAIELSFSPIDLTGCGGGFFAFSLTPSESSPIQVETLTLSYDPSAPQSLYSELDGETLELFSLYMINWDDILGSDQTADVDLLSLAELKMAEPGAIESDIIAGIDLSSVTTDGDTTRFTSVMSNGEAIRFEATNISIDETGIRLAPGASITSLDALGRIYLYTALVDDAQQYDNDCILDFGYGYTYSASKTSVDHADQVHTYPSSGLGVAETIYENRVSFVALQPNFVYIYSNPGNSQDILLTSLSVGYDPTEKVTGISAARLDQDFGKSYLSGDAYDLALEKAINTYDGTLEFYLILQPDTEYADINSDHLSICFVPGRFITLGDLKNANGEVLDKENDEIVPGDTLDITIGDYSLALELDVLDRYAGASTLKELLPYSTLSALGENNTLVVPVVWADQTEAANDENYALYQSAIGRIIDVSGVVTDYSDPNDTAFSLSEYFDIASYGKFSITSFLTDWYYAGENFSDISSVNVDKNYADGIVLWIKQTYPDLDWSRYDQDADGYIDSLVIINAGVSSDDSYVVNSYGGAIAYRESYFADNAGTQDDPGVNTFVTINQSFLRDGATGTLIHEFSHLLGLIDYYDVTYSGINAVGGFDMQSDNVGDWNSYSKLAVGWMAPQVISGLASGESLELTIGSSALTDDVIIIPSSGAQYDGPFGEYIMIDLFSDKGVNVYSAGEYGLRDSTGIRISHVNANMEMRTIKAAAGATGDDLIDYTIGTIHYPNSYNERGMYNIEVIQAGRMNTFTNLGVGLTKFSADDLFRTGDVFTLADYSEFFYNGLMDNGSEFGYTISVVNIGLDETGAPVATIRITAD